MWIKTKKLTPKIIGKVPTFEETNYMFKLSEVVSVTAKSSGDYYLPFTQITFKNGDYDNVSITLSEIQELIEKQYER